MNSLTLAYNDHSICSVVDSLWSSGSDENRLVFLYLFEATEEAPYRDYTYLVDLFHASAPLATGQQIEEYKCWLLKLAANYIYSQGNIYQKCDHEKLLYKYRTI